MFGARYFAGDYLDAWYFEATGSGAVVPVAMPVPQGNLSIDLNDEQKRLRKRRKFEDTQRQRVNETIDRILNPPPEPPRDMSRDYVTLAGKVTEAEAAAAALRADDDEAILAIILAA